MKAIVVEQAGSPADLAWREVPDPVVVDGHVLIDVAAGAVNRADLLQAAGHYPPPPGAPETIGLECSGVIATVGADVARWRVGDRVCALLAGGGYAEKVVVPAGQVLPVPNGVDLVEAAGLPEVACTVWSNLVMTAGLRAGQTLLVHGGGSGIGTMAIQVARLLGARVAVTASRDAVLDRCRDLGADITINYANEDFVDALLAATDGRGADVILDVIGAKYLARNISALADGGRLVIIGLQGGTRAELDINALMRKRAGVIGTTLRSRPVSGPGSKSEIVERVRTELWPQVAAGQVRPIIASVLDMPEAAQAHARMTAGGHVGKIVLRVPATGT
jgi:putative PIG3 family NAD(P)H quinone oxidoreductase